jgi:hypothetical protein
VKGQTTRGSGHFKKACLSEGPFICRTARDVEVILSGQVVQYLVLPTSQILSRIHLGRSILLRAHVYIREQ